HLLPTLQADLARQYLQAGVKNIGTVVLLSEAQLPEEHFLVPLNDFLASGE
ncbi:DYH17 protein, partial [Psilopogon haemacephalus]|nr:DYH17 protein [Psilopogon haemacephalus]